MRMIPPLRSLSQMLLFSLTISLLPIPTTTILNATEGSSAIILSNECLSLSMNKSTGYIDSLYLDNQNLLGVRDFEAETPGSHAGGQNGVLNLDCYCIPDGVYTPGGIDPYFEVFEGDDWVGVMMGEVYPP